MKKNKTPLYRTGVFLLILSLMFSCLPLTALAEDVKKNHTVADAYPVAFDSEVTDAIEDKGEEDFYSLTLPAAGRLSVEFTSYMECYSVLLFDAKGNEVWKATNNRWNAATEMATNTHEADLAAGDYFLLTDGKSHTVSGVVSATGSYRFTLSFTPSGETVAEPNQSADAAAPVDMTADKEIYGQIAENDPDDFLSFSLETSGRLSLRFTSYLQYYSLFLYDKTGAEVFKKTNNLWNETAGMAINTHTLDLAAGDYVLQIDGKSHNNAIVSTGNYHFLPTFLPSGETIAEPNQSLDAAAPIDVAAGKEICGQIAENDPDDFLSFSLTESGRLSLQFTSYLQYYSLFLYDKAGTEVFRKVNNKWNQTSEMVANTHILDLAAGDYVLQIDGKSHQNAIVSTGNYRFTPAFTPAGETITEPNQSAAQAFEIDVNAADPHYGQIAVNDASDYFRFTMATKANLSIRFTSYMEFYSLFLYDSDGKEVWKAKANKWDAAAGSVTNTHTVPLDEGAYVLLVDGESTSALTYTGNYTVIFGTDAVKPPVVTLEPAEAVYNGETLSPGIVVTTADGEALPAAAYTVTAPAEPPKAAGSYEYTVAYLGDYAAFGEQKATFTIKPYTLTSADVSLSPAAEPFSGNAHAPAVTVTSPWKETLKEGTDYTVKAPNEIVDPGVYTFEITGSGNYTGTITKEFTVTPEAETLTADNVTLYAERVTYNGNVRNPKVTVTGRNGELLTKGTDYKVEIPEGRKDAGTYVYKITGMGQYAGVAEKAFIIDPAPLSAGTVSLYAARVEYNGKQRDPVVTVKNAADEKLTKDRDYTLTVPAGRTLPGTYVYTVKGTGNYTGSAEARFVIDPSTLTAENVSLYAAKVEYNGRERTPKITVKAPWGVTLTEGTHYTVTVPSGRKTPGVYIYTIKGMGRFSGTVKANFVIVPCALTSANVTLYSAKVEYNGKERTPRVTVKAPWGDVLTEGVHYTVSVPEGRTLPGTYVYKITGKGAFTGNVNESFVIRPCTLTAVNVNLYSAKVEYNGKVRTPQVTVKAPWGETLKEGVHYTVTVPSGRTVPGTYVYTITGKGRFTGSVNESFVIKPCTLSAANVSLYSAVVEYNGKTRTPKVTVKSPWGVTLKEGTHYTVTVPKGRVNAGTYVYKITGKGRFTGTVTASFVIKPQTLTASNVTLYSGTVTYNGKVRTPSVTVKNDAGNTLKAGTDYTVTVPTGRVNVGAYTYKITGKGNYSGTVSKVFTIKAK